MPENDQPLEINEQPREIAYTVKINQLVNGHLTFENPTNDPAQLERILLQALAYIQRELIAGRTAAVIVKAMQGPRILPAGGPGVPPDLLRGR